MPTRRNEIGTLLADVFSAGRGLDSSMASDVCHGKVITKMEEENETAVIDQYGTTTAEYTITVERFAEAGELSASQATEILGQLITEIPDDESLGGLADWCRYSGGGIIPRGEGSGLAGGRIALSVQYRFNINDPSTLTEV